ncbi:hypothetical protein ACS0TY_023911 [Phlomoides rotata]
MPHCRRNLSNIPAIVFSGRGHAENSYHAFADLLFPLFSTSHHFNRRTIFLVTNHYSPLTDKYRAILRKLSKYDVVDIDKENDVLCFSRMIVGLKSPTYQFIHPNESGNFPIRRFGGFLRRAYALERDSVHVSSASQPRLLILSRDKSRRLLNERQVADVARRLGFYAVVKKLTSDVALVAKLVNSFDVMVGVHGAGLANLVFLPERAVVIQINPFGLELEGMICFGYAAQSMKLSYLEYKVSLNESSLLGKYDDDVEVYTHPAAIRENNKGKFHYVYLDDQDVNIDLDRFRKTLLTGLELLRT